MIQFGKLPDEPLEVGEFLFALDLFGWVAGAVELGDGAGPVSHATGPGVIPLGRILIDRVVGDLLKELVSRCDGLRRVIAGIVRLDGGKCFRSTLGACRIPNYLHPLIGLDLLGTLLRQQDRLKRKRENEVLHSMLHNP